MRSRHFVVILVVLHESGVLRGLCNGHQEDKRGTGRLFKISGEKPDTCEEVLEIYI